MGLSFLTRRPIAHRGLHDGNNNRWENTLSAFDAAVKRDYAIELDVELSADGKALVFHDSALKRLTGREGHIHELTAGEASKIAIGGTSDFIPTLSDVLDLVAGRVPLVIELKGNAGHDKGLVKAVSRDLAGYKGEAAIMSFAHWHIRRFAADAPAIPAGLTAEGAKPRQLEDHFAMLANGISFVSFDVDALPNPFVTFVRERLSMPVITWTVRTPEQVAQTRRHADQMTFEGFLPD
jgi:glycerophosphoryl diester phosphodiesterase